MGDYLSDKHKAVLDTLLDEQYFYGVTLKSICSMKHAKKITTTHKKIANHHKHHISHRNLQKGLQKKYMLVGIGLGIVLFVFILLSFYSSQTPSSHPGLEQWKTYGELVASGDLEPAKKILEVSVQYDEASSPSLRFTSFAQKNGYAPKVLSENNTHAIELLTKDGRVLFQRPFILSVDFHSEIFGQDGGSYTISPSNFAFGFTLPWFDNAATVRILDNSGNVIISNPLTNVKHINNKPTFLGINGATEKQSSMKTSFIPSAYAQTTGKTLNFAIIDNNYDLTTFHADVEKIKVRFLAMSHIKLVPHRLLSIQLIIQLIYNVRVFILFKAATLTRLINRLTRPVFPMTSP